MELLHTIEQLGLARLLKGSFFAYPAVSAVHIAAVGTLFACVIMVDLSVLGAIRSVPRIALVPLLRRVALAGFAVAVLSGAMLFSVQATTYADNPAFLLKLSLIAVAATNFAVFLALDRKPSGQASAALRVSALMSVVLWGGVLLCGRLIGFV